MHSYVLCSISDFELNADGYVPRCAVDLPLRPGDNCLTNKKGVNTLSKYQEKGE